MSAASFQSTTSSFASGRKNDIFQDLPLLDKSTRLTVMELKNCDKQIINELVYRWCRILTRPPKKLVELPSIFPPDTSMLEARKVLIIDLTGSFSVIRLGSVLKRDEKRLRKISIARGCKINSTYVTINSYLGPHTLIPNSLKLVVIYHDEFFILKTLELLRDCIRSTKCQIVLVVPRLDRRDKDVLNITSSNQILRCDFCVNRRELGRVQQGSNEESQLNQVYFQPYQQNKSHPERIFGELREDMLYVHAKPQSMPRVKLALVPIKEVKDDPEISPKRIRRDTIDIILSSF